MAFIPVDDVAVAEIVVNCQGQKCENTLYFKHGTLEWDEEQLTALGEALLEWWGMFVAPKVTQAAFVVEVKVTSLNSDVAPSVTVTSPPGVVKGEDLLQPLPNNTTLCISLRTGSRGKWARGRNYTIGMCTDHIVGNFANTDYVSSMVNAYNQIFPLAETLGCTWVVVSRHLNKVPRLTGVTYDVTAVIVADLALDSQRRRLVGRGQ